MCELLNKLNELPDVYDDFLFGVINYVKRSPLHIQRLMDFLESADNLTTSDVVEYMIFQPDFHDRGMRNEQCVS